MQAPPSLPLSPCSVDHFLLNHLSSKWESRINPATDFRLFLTLNHAGTLLGSATSSA